MNVFLIESPLQLLNAIEAKTYYQLKNEDSLLLLQNGEIPESLEQMKSMINADIWPNVRIVGTGKGKISWFTRMIALKKIAKKVGQINLLFLGDYRSDLMKDFANTVNYKKLVVIDDGAATINTYKNLVGKEEINVNHFSNLSKTEMIKNITKKILYFGNAPSSFTPKQIDLFTVYNLPSENRVKVHKNEYYYHKSINKQKLVEGKIYFLGAPLSEKKVIKSNEEYFNYLLLIKESLPKLPIVYVPHRAEESDKIRKIKELGFNIEQNHTCVEHMMIYSNTIPEYIISFYSSALINLKKMMSPEVKIISYQLPYEDLEPKMRSTIKSVYDYYENEVLVRQVIPD